MVWIYQKQAHLLKLSDLSNFINKATDFSKKLLGSAKHFKSFTIVQNKSIIAITLLFFSKSVSMFLLMKQPSHLAQSRQAALVDMVSSLQSAKHSSHPSYTSPTQAKILYILVIK